jgi:hypothetical protein
MRALRFCFEDRRHLPDDFRDEAWAESFCEAADERAGSRAATVAIHFAGGPKRSESVNPRRNFDSLLWH